MPTVRCEIKNEFGLANPELYRAANKNEPEALLEGIAMAGLVGVLKQLGDLAEFAVEIFDDLHKEVVATAARGHRLMLRVQQVEVELPSIGKAFLSKSNQIHFAYNTGIDWRSKLQMDQNLITKGDIPCFIMDSYEECRGPPQLYMLDKFDVAGAGACLKRYSDPSFFKIELTSSSMVKSEVQIEKRARKNEKKGLCWRNGETSESFLAPHMNSKLQSSDQSAEEVSERRVKLKYSHLNGSDTGSKSYMEHLLKVLSTEQNSFSENSISHSGIELRSTDSTESISEVHEVVIDASDSIERNPKQFPTKKEVTGLPKKGLEKQTIKVKELPETLSEDESRTEGSADGYQLDELKVSSPGNQELDQKELSSAGECTTEGSDDGYWSDDIVSDLDRYMDALTTMESEVETDSENSAKPNLGFANKKSQGMDSGTHEEQELQAQYSEPDSDENSSLVGVSNSFEKGILSTSYKDTQPLHWNGIVFDVPAKSDICLDETNYRISDHWRNCEVLKLKSLEHLLYNGISNVKASDIRSSRSEFGEASCSSITVSTSAFDNLCPHESPENAQSITANLSELSSSFAETTDEVAEDLDGESAEKSRIPFQIKDDKMFLRSMKNSDIFFYALLHKADQLHVMKDDVLEKINLEEYAKELVLKDMTVPLDKPGYLSKGQDGSILEEVPAGLIEDSPSNLFIGESQESIKQVTEVSPGGTISLLMSSIPPSRSSLVKYADAPDDDVASPRSEVSLENTNTSIEGKIPNSTVLPLKLEPLSDAEEPRKSRNMESMKFISSCSEKRGFPDDKQQPSKVSDPPKDAVPIESVASCDYSSTLNFIVEAESSNRDPCSVCSPEASGFYVHLEEEHVPDVAVLDQDNVEIFDKSVPKNITVSDGVSTPHRSLPSLEEDQLMSASMFANSEKSILDSSGPADARLLNNVCHALPSEHVQIDLHLHNGDKASINSIIEKDFGLKASLCCYQESAREDIVPSTQLLTEVAKPIEEAPELQPGSIPNIISFERYLSLKWNNIQSKPMDLIGKTSDTTPEPDSHVNGSNGKFDELLELLHVDLLPKIGEEVPKYPLNGENGFGSEVSLQCSQSAKEDLFPSSPTETTNPFEEASELQTGREPIMISLQQDNELLGPSNFSFEGAQFVEQKNNASSSMDVVGKLLELESEAESHVIISNGMFLPPPNTSRCVQPLPEGSVPLQCSSELHESSLASNISDMALLTFPSFGLSIPETTPQQSSEPQSGDPVSSCPVPDDIALQDAIEETPPLPPLPPLEWRLGKLRMEPLTSDLNMAQPSSVPNLFTTLSNIDKKPLHGLLTVGVGMVQQSNQFAPLMGLEEEKPQSGSLTSEMGMMQPVNLSEIPPIVDVRHKLGDLHLEGKMVHALNPSLIVSPIEDDKHLYCHQAFGGGMLQPSNPFSASENSSSEHSLSVLIPSLENEISQIDRLLSSSELEIFQHGPSSLEKVMVQPPSPFFVHSPTEGEKHQYGSGVTGGVHAEEEHVYSLDNFTIPTSEDEKPKRKIHSILNRPKDPLIDAVASHDKSMLRKVPELVQPSTKPKAEERDTLLEQIRNKSHNLKPAVGTKPNIRGPSTNLKVAAILEKANAIRQAIVGSDDDDDRDSWSDS